MNSAWLSYVILLAFILLLFVLLGWGYYIVQHIAIVVLAPNKKGVVTPVTKEVQKTMR